MYTIFSNFIVVHLGKRSVSRAVPVVEQSPSLSLIVSSVCEGAGHVTIGVVLESDIKKDLYLRIETVADSAKGEHL